MSETVDVPEMEVLATDRNRVTAHLRATPGPEALGDRLVAAYREECERAYEGLVEMVYRSLSESLVVEAWVESWGEGESGAEFAVFLALGIDGSRQSVERFIERHNVPVEIVATDADHVVVQ